MSTKTKIFIIVIVILAAAVRLAAVLKYGNFWDDEMFNFIYSQKPWPGGLVYWLWETNPPLHLLILKIWFLFLPATEFFARLPGVFAGTATVYLIYRFGRKIFNEKIALVAAIYLALHPYHIFWSATARIYVFLMLFALWSAAYFWQIYFNGDDSPPARRKSAVINFLLIFSHLSSIFFLAGQFAALLIFKGGKTAVAWIKNNLIPFILGGLWIGASFFVKTQNDLNSAWFLNLRHTFQSAVSPVANLFAGLQQLYAGLIITLLLIIITIFAIRKENKNLFLPIITVTLFPVLCALVFGVWHIKFFVLILPLIVLLASFALTKILRRASVAALAVFLICLTGICNLWLFLPLNDWSQINAFYRTVEARAKNAGFVYNNYILKWQIDRYLPDLSAKSTPPIMYENFSFDDMTVKKNYLFTFIPEEKKDRWYQANKLDKYSTIVLLQGEHDYMNKLDDLFARHGWKVRGQPEQAPICGIYRLYVLEKH